MTKQRAIRLAAKWAAGGVCTLREGEAQEYHELCLEALKETQWISVEERLPEDCVTVLVWYEDSDSVGFNFYDYTFNAWFYGTKKVTHWMPFPNGPEEE